MIPKIIITLAIIFYITNQVESSSPTSEKDEENSELNQTDFSSQEIEETTTLGTSENSESTSHHHHDHKFDFILFAQVWPISNCIDWEERSEDNTCSLPSKYLVLLPFFFLLYISLSLYPGKSAFTKVSFFFQYLHR